MSIKVQQRKRDRKNRKKHNVIVISCEGNNKTEKNYFSNFRTREQNIKFCTGNDTDPIQMIKNLKEFIVKQDIDFESEDKVYCIFDTDLDKNKQKQIDKAIKLAKGENIELIMSVPSFEIWYLLHFKYSSKSFNTNKQLLKELSKNIPEYNKCMDVYRIICSKTEEAIKHAKKLKKYHKIKEEDIINNIKYNPSTDVYKVIEYILEHKEYSR